ncbi:MULTISPECIES: hypothetical protein [unclassified Lentimonas]|uniref:hypothetical protein n=1 Tax=unclassified Lentimonas TaxID=2630993 RepID=UPI00132464BE|nr:MULTISPECIES: hypothetical protein [unclassified Lentimonas]CAA6694208.1 Unannotated [Lentimonas sp. CC10]CAA6694299.1 Unannotated [Lentimonas sp. CC19]CAA7071072.1 Unannotated [Lentimonas sp. CC11]
MSKLPEERPADINLEDLLRLKRSERPSDAFWNDFDRDLHQRMLQTLVKKDPWYFQLTRAFSGRIGQSIAVAAAAAVVAMVVVRPAFQPVAGPESFAVAPMPLIEMAQAPAVEAVSPPVEVAVASLSLAEIADLNSAADYHADRISVNESANDVNFVRDFGMESMQVASYEASAYSGDTAHARVSFASTGVASLVY